MPAKSKSPEAAQKKVWKAELKAHIRALSKVQKDELKARRAAVKNLRKAELEYSKVVNRINREVPKATETIERRIAILQGRIGI